MINQVEQYFLGFFLSDGHIQGKSIIRFTNSLKDSEIFKFLSKNNIIVNQEIRNYYNNIWIHQGITLPDNLKQLMFQEGFLKNKVVIQKRIWNKLKTSHQLTDEIMFNIILGIVDGDGTVTNSNLSIYGMDEETFKNIKEFIQEFLGKYNIEVKIKEKKKLPKNKKQPYYSVLLESPTQKYIQKELVKILNNYPDFNYYKHRKIEQLQKSNPKPRIIDETIKEKIQKLYEQGYKQTQIQRELHISRDNVKYWIKRMKLNKKGERIKNFTLTEITLSDIYQNINQFIKSGVEEIRDEKLIKDGYKYIVDIKNVELNNDFVSQQIQYFDKKFNQEEKMIGYRMYGKENYLKYLKEFFKNDEKLWYSFQTEEKTIKQYKLNRLLNSYQVLIPEIQDVRKPKSPSLKEILTNKELFTKYFVKHVLIDQTHQVIDTKKIDTDKYIIKFKNKQNNINIERLISLSLRSLFKINVFSPQLQRQIIFQLFGTDQKFDLLIDPFQGFMGRMLGLLDKISNQFILNDQNDKLTKRYQKIIDFYNLDKEFLQNKKYYFTNFNMLNENQIEQFQELIQEKIKEINSKNILLLTSPPYGRKEIYFNDKSIQQDGFFPYLEQINKLSNLIIQKTGLKKENIKDLIVQPNWQLLEKQTVLENYSGILKIIYQPEKLLNSEVKYFDVVLSQFINKESIFNIGDYKKLFENKEQEKTNHKCQIKKVSNSKYTVIPISQHVLVQNNSSFQEFLKKLNLYNWNVLLNKSFNQGYKQTLSEKKLFDLYGWFSSGQQLNCKVVEQFKSIWNKDYKLTKNILESQLR